MFFRHWFHMTRTYHIILQTSENLDWIRLYINVRRMRHIASHWSKKMCMKIYCEYCGLATWKGEEACRKWLFSRTSSDLFFRLRPTYCTSAERCANSRTMPMCERTNFCRRWKFNRKFPDHLARKTLNWCFSSFSRFTFIYNKHMSSRDCRTSIHTKRTNTSLEVHSIEVIIETSLHVVCNDP